MKITLELDRRTTLRWLLGAVFIWAAVSKLANLQDFYTSLVAYRLPLPDLCLRLAAVTLPWLELFCGLMLLTQFWLRTAATWVVVLCAVFTVCTGQAWARHLEISCGCLNLDFIGLGSAAKSFLESVGFAFFRALFLLAAGSYLLCQTGPVSPKLALSITPPS